MKKINEIKTIRGLVHYIIRRRIDAISYGYSRQEMYDNELAVASNCVGMTEDNAKEYVKKYYFEISKICLRQERDLFYSKCKEILGTNFIENYNYGKL